MIEINETNIKLFKDMSSDVELMKVLSGYLIDGKNKNVSERIQIGDSVKYYGRTGMEIPVLVSEIKRLNSSIEEISKAGVRFENAVIDIYSIVKENGKYESKEKKFSISSFVNLIDNVHRLIATNNLTTFGHIEEYMQKLDPESDEAKSCNVYLELCEEHCFNFTLLKYDSITNDVRNTIRSWYIWDTNDIELRSIKEFCDEFNLPASL